MIYWRIERTFDFGDDLMSSETIHQLVDSMSPTEALTVMGNEIRRLFSHLGEEARINFLKGLMQGNPEDKESSLVHL